MAYVGKITDTDGVTGLVGSTLYGTCATAAGTAAKVVTCSDFDELLTGVTIHVKFTNGNTAASPTLNVNSTGAKAIFRFGTNAGSTSLSWTAGQVVSFTYDGTQWHINDAAGAVYQSASTTSNYRSVMLSYNSSATANDPDLADSKVTGQVYANTFIYAKPSVGYLFAKGFQDATWSTAPTSDASSLVAFSLINAGLHFRTKYLSENESTYDYSRNCLRTYPGKITSSDGLLLTLDSGGLTIVGGGESATSLANLISLDQNATSTTPTKLDVGGTLATAFTGNSEHLILSADGNIYFLTNCNTVANRKPVCLDNSSYFYPGTNSTGSIGTSSYRWGNGYFTTLNTPNIKNTVSSTTYTQTFPAVTGTVINSACAGTGLSWDSANIKLNHSNSVTAVSHYFRPYMQYDAQGHVTASSYWMHKATGTGGTAGWVKVATMKHIKTYDNTPILLNVSQRGNIISYRIHMLWNNGDTKDPALKEFLIMSDHNWEAITPRAYLIKSTTSTWDLYILKLDSYENIAISMQPGGYFDDHMEWTWKNEQTAASAITGGTEATKKVYSTTDHTHNSLTSKILDTIEVTLDGTAGNFFFKGDNLIGGSVNEDYVGIQADSGNDKFQLMAFDNNLLFRQNDTGGTNTTNWQAWKCFMSPDSISCADGISRIAESAYIIGSGSSAMVIHSITLGHTNSVTAGTAKGDNSKTLTFGGTFTVPSVTYDAQGHITAKGTTTMTMPANPNTDSNVKQSTSGYTGFRPIVLGYTSTATVSDLDATVTNQVYVTTKLYTQPSTGKLYSDGGFYVTKSQSGLALVDSTGFSYTGIGDNGSNLWIGANAQSSQHHTGKTFISTGYDGTHGNSTVWLSIPNDTNTTATNYPVLHTGNMNVEIPSTKYAFVVDESSDFASYAWHKFAEVTVTDANADATITFIVSKTWGNMGYACGILTAHIRTGSTKVYGGGHFRWLVIVTTEIDPDEFVMVYTNTASTSCKVELWHKQTERWDGWVFKVLKEHSRTTYGAYPWTLFKHSGHGLAAYTAGTGTIVSAANTIANTSASADKINTDAGDFQTPVYFSNGVPVEVNIAASGAYFGTVPQVRQSDGVMEIGKYIDFHTTNASTNDYDMRLLADSENIITLTSKGGSTAFRITGTLPRLRFQQTTSGKAYSDESCGIWCQPSSTNGVNMFMQSGGNIMIGAGEFASNAYNRKDSTGTTQVGYDNIVDSTTEKLYLGADNEVQIISNGQSIATYSNNNHKVWTFGTDGTLTTPGAIKDSLDNQHTMIQQNLKSTSNCVALTWWIVDGVASATTRPGIYYHNTGGNSTDKGAIILQPYHSSSNPWDSTHPIGLYIGKGILQLDGVDVSLSTHTHETLTCKSVTATTVNNTAGCFFFKGDNLLGGINDWVGIQADAGNDKFQLVPNGVASLMYRQNDIGGTNSANWSDWVGLLTPSKVTTDTYLSVEATTTTLGSGTTALTYDSGVKISHKAYTAQSSGLYKITVDAAGHVSAATALTITPTPSSKTHTNWDTSAERAYLVTKGWVSYWNGAYNSNNASNLTYCNRGAFGTIVTKSDTDYVPNTTDGVNAAINLLNSGTSVPTNDDTCYISQDTNTSNTGYYRRPIVKLWQYMVDRSIAFYYNGTADFADAPWAKVISMKCASASSYRHIALLVSKTHYNATDKYSWGILCIKFATNSSKNYDTASGVGTCDWLVAHGNIATTDFKIMYTNTGTTSTTVDIWCKAGHRYASYVFKVLNDTMRGLSGAAYVGTSNIELFSVNGAGVAETAVTGTEITQTLTTIANTSARANTVSGTITNPTSATQYAIPFHSGTSTAAKTLRNNNGLQYKTLEGTASAEGYGALMLGNSTATGTAANKYGFLRLYSRNTSYVDLVAASTTTARTQTLPNMTGTHCCLSKNSTSYWGLYDGDASGTAWLRTTSNGFIPYTAGKFTETNTSALGTDSWWFNKAYIREIQTGVIKFRSGNTESNTTRSYLQLQQGITGNYDWRLPPASGEVMIRKGSVTAGASQAILYSGTTSGWGHQSVEVFNIFKNWSLIVVNFMGGGYGYSSTDKHSFSSVVPLDFVKMKGASPTEPYFIPVPANGTNVDATELIECIYVDDSTIEFNRSGASGGIGKITIWGIY